MLKIVKFTDVCMTGGIMHTPSHTNVCTEIFQFLTYISSGDITPEILKIGRVTKVKVLFLVLVFVFNLAYSNVFEFSAAILEKGLLGNTHTPVALSSLIFFKTAGITLKGGKA